MEKRYSAQVQAIVSRNGGFREKDILSRPHTMEKGETWNAYHKVVNVFEREPSSDGHRNGFAVDLVNGNICG